jgi:hypothetical protein
LHKLYLQIKRKLVTIKLNGERMAQTAAEKGFIPRTEPTIADAPPAPYPDERSITESRVAVANSVESLKHWGHFAYDATLNIGTTGESTTPESGRCDMLGSCLELILTNDMRFGIGGARCEVQRQAQ